MQTNAMQWKIGGEAGFGIMTTGLIFSRICARGGLKVFAYPEYPSLIRGGQNTYQITVDGEQATAQLKDVHMLVCLNKETFDLQQDQLVDTSAVVYDPKDFKDEQPSVEGKEIVWVPVAMTDILTEHKAAKVARNTISIGASFGLLNYPWEHVEAVIRDWFSRKKPEVIESNVSLAKAGYDAVADKAEHFPYRLEAQESTTHMVISGNGAAALGALQAGMKFFAAYPMTPSSDFLSYFAKLEPKFNLVVKHTEDEIAAMNMVIGAGFTGVRAMTATSGGGFALMSEALGMAGLAEVPLVTIMGQRPGPSTGLPTWTSQADLRFVLHASQGEFPRIVLAPGDATESFYMTHEAFNLAERYQVPVIVLLDKYNQQSYETVEPFDTSELSIDRGKLITQEDVNKIVERDGEYLRFKITEDGISERALPGMIGARHIGSSYEHEENGYTTEEEDETTRQNDKRFRKLEVFLENDAKAPVWYGPEDADVTVVGWGSTKLPMMEALRRAEKEGVSINYLHFTYIDPFPAALALPELQKAKKTLCVEGNKLGQFEGWVREQTGFEMTGNFHKYGGRPFYAEEILEQAKSL